MTDANPSSTGSKKKTQVDLELEEILSTLGKLELPKKSAPAFVPEEPIEQIPAPFVPGEPLEQVSVPYGPDAPMEQVSAPYGPEAPMERITAPHDSGETVVRVSAPPLDQEDYVDPFQTQVYNIIRSDKPMARPAPLKPTLPKPVTRSPVKPSAPRREQTMPMEPPTEMEPPVQKEPDVLAELLRESAERKAAASMLPKEETVTYSESPQSAFKEEVSMQLEEPQRVIQKEVSSNEALSEKTSTKEPAVPAKPPEQGIQHEQLILNTSRFDALKMPLLSPDQEERSRVALPLVMEDDGGASELDAPEMPVPDAVYNQRVWTVSAMEPCVPMYDQQETPVEEEEEEPRTLLQKVKHEAFEWGRALLFVLVPILLLFNFVVKLVEVDGASMSPTLESGQRLVISKMFYTPQNGDIVVTSAKNGLSKPLIKRIIATGGQTLDIDSTGNVLVNGIPIYEPYVSDLIADRGDLTYPVTVPAGSVFVMGDNRNHSLDSRNSTVGFLPESELLGRVLLRIYPFGDFGTVK